jgi:hypothetical protein
LLDAPGLGFYPLLPLTAVLFLLSVTQSLNPSLLRSSQPSRTPLRIGFRIIAIVVLMLDLAVKRSFIWYAGTGLIF